MDGLYYYYTGIISGLDELIIELYKDKRLSLEVMDIINEHREQLRNEATKEQRKNM